MRGEDELLVTPAEGGPHLGKRCKLCLQMLGYTTSEGLRLSKCKSVYFMVATGV